jgi:hypothetical protein
MMLILLLNFFIPTYQTTYRNTVSVSSLGGGRRFGLNVTLEFEIHPIAQPAPGCLIHVISQSDGQFLNTTYSTALEEAFLCHTQLYVDAARTTPYAYTCVCVGEDITVYI